MAKAKSSLVINLAFLTTQYFICITGYCQINIGQNSNQLNVLKEKTNIFILTSPGSLEKRIKIKRISHGNFGTKISHLCFNF